MLVTESRPRNLTWFHAGPLLYGDWGTSRLYVLGLAFLYTAHASVIYLAAIAILMIAVSWAYTIICRCFPDGGGVYTAARHLSPTLAVVGATLLLSGYVMTAAISVVEAFHYFGVPHDLTLPLSVVTIVLLGGVNWLGAKSAGRFAMVVAFAALAVSAGMFFLALPFFWRGIQTISFDYFKQVPAGDAWVTFTKLCLALAGVEAVANMTGLMSKPVRKTAKRTIWPVSIEVVSLNMVFGLALTGLAFIVGGTALSEMKVPDELRLAERRAEVASLIESDLGRPIDGSITVEIPEADLTQLSETTSLALEGLRQHEREVGEYTTASMKVIARETGTHFFGSQAGFVIGKVAGITFGLLLLSATNTAIMATVSVLFAMGQDRELPKSTTKLNYSGVPWVGLIVAVVVPIGVILWTTDVTLLAKLYVLGVCGAITVCILSSVLNKDLEIGPKSRIGFWVLGLFLLAVSVTIAVTQPISTAFSGGMIAVMLGMRWALRLRERAKPPALDEPKDGWLAEVKDRPMSIDPTKPKVMLASRGRYQSEFAVDLARRRGGTLFAVFVRVIRVMDLRAGSAPSLENDADALEALGTTAVLAREAGVPFVPIYVASPEIADEILDFTVTYGCDTLIMGKSKRSVFSRTVTGDVVTQVAHDLPDDVALITRSADTPHVPRPRPTDLADS